MRLLPDAVLVMQILTATEPLVLPRKERLVIGRAGAAGLRNPDVDLTSWGALRFGVSRVHAAIEIRDEAVFLTDLGSTNGTYLNARQLSPNETRIVCSGDEMCFGNLLARLYFRQLAELDNA
jgi:pSer/pThr/pTyr-binding forkhead associated (FHA) protein